MDDKAGLKEAIRLAEERIQKWMVVEGENARLLEYEARIGKDQLERLLKI